MSNWKKIIINNIETNYSINEDGVVKNSKTERVLKQCKNGRYLSVSLGSSANKFLIHRLVAMAFIENPNNYNIVNHKDENTTNNNFRNLEWCTQKHNLNYGIMKTCRNSEVIQMNDDYSVIKQWDSIKDASEFLNISSSSISQCCRGIINHACGFRWKYVAGFENRNRRIKQRGVKRRKSQIHEENEK